MPYRMIRKKQVQIILLKVSKVVSNVSNFFETLKIIMCSFGNVKGYGVQGVQLFPLYCRVQGKFFSTYNITQYRLIGPKNHGHHGHIPIFGDVVT